MQLLVLLLLLCLSSAGWVNTGFQPVHLLLSDALKPEIAVQKLVDCLPR